MFYVATGLSGLICSQSVLKTKAHWAPEPVGKAFEVLMDKRTAAENGADFFRIRRRLSKLGRLKIVYPL